MNDIRFSSHFMVDFNTWLNLILTPHAKVLFSKNGTLCSHFLEELREDLENANYYDFEISGKFTKSCKPEKFSYSVVVQKNGDVMIDTNIFPTTREIWKNHKQSIIAFCVIFTCILILVFCS